MKYYIDLNLSSYDFINLPVYQLKASAKKKNKKIQHNQCSNKMDTAAMLQ